MKDRTNKVNEDMIPYLIHLKELATWYGEKCNCPTTWLAVETPDGGSLDFRMDLVVKAAKEALYYESYSDEDKKLLNDCKHLKNKLYQYRKRLETKSQKPGMGMLQLMLEEQEIKRNRTKKD